MEVLMGRFAASFVLLTVCVFFPVRLFSQTLESGDSRIFYSDVAGHHGLGEGSGATEREALRLAKAKGIDVVFRELNKDDMFIEIFISKWPEAIVLEESAVREEGEGSYAAKVRVRIDRQTVLLTEQTYQESAINLLDRAETILDDAEPKVRAAQGYEENMRLGEAYTNYKQAETKLDELTLLLNPLGDSSLQSSEGNAKPALIAVEKTLRKTVESGLNRLAEIEKETEVSQTTEEIQRTYNLLLEEKAKVDTVKDEYLPLSPFYDLPQAELDAMLQEIRQAIDLNGDIREKLKGLREGVPRDKVYLSEKIELSRKECEQSGETLERLEEEVKAEIRLPRLVRQERAYKRKAFGEKLGYVLLKREPRDVFMIRYYLPFGLDAGGDPRFGLTREFEIKAAVEYYFTDFVWFQTAVWKDDLFLESEIKDVALSQEAHLGFGGRFFVGGGAAWNWARWVKSSGRMEKTVGNFTIDVVAGGMDLERQWPWGILTLSLPIRPGLFVFNGKLNVEMELQLRIAALFQIETGISSGFYNSAPAETLDDIKADPDSYVTYQFRYFGLFGVRLPKPFMWGLRIEGGREGPGDPMPTLFRLFLQYSI